MSSESKGTKSFLCSNRCAIYYCWLWSLQQCLFAVSFLNVSFHLIYPKDIYSQRMSRV